MKIMDPEYDKYGYEYEPYKKIINKNLDKYDLDEVLKLIKKSKQFEEPKKTQEEKDMEILEKMDIKHIEKFLRNKKLQNLNK